MASEVQASDEEKERLFAYMQGISANKVCVICIYS